MEAIKRKKFFLIPFVVIACLGLVSYAVMLLWNELMPALFSVPPITFWQAAGLFILCKILFGFGSGRGKRFGQPWARRMGSCEPMEATQRERFRTAMEERWCGFRKKAGTETDGSSD